MDFLETLSKMSSLLIGIITLIVVLAKMDNRIAVLEEKVRTLFELWNKKDK
jgi:hypothetical protein